MQTLLHALPDFSAWLLGLAVILLVFGWRLRRYAQHNLLKIQGVSQTISLHIGGSNHAPVTQSNVHSSAQAPVQAPVQAQTGWTWLSRLADGLQVLGFAILILQITKVIA